MSTPNAEYERGDEWHGWRLGNVTLHVGPLPGRKRVALYMSNGNVIDPMAYFRNESAAYSVLVFLEQMAAARYDRGSDA